MALYMRTNGVTKKVGTSSPSAIPASNSTYDNTQSGLSADNVQNAIDEINLDLTAKTVVRQNYVNGETVANVTVKEASPKGHGYLVFFPQFIGTSDIVLDARYVYISENGLSIYSSWFVHNSTNNLTSITYSGNTITFTFANAVYCTPCYLKIM